MSMKNRETSIKFMMCQVQKIDIDKWYEGLRIHRDPSSEYIMNWVSNNAQMYREKWFHSTCVTCPLWEQCGWKAVEQCHEGEIVMDSIMNEIFKKQYHEQSTIGGHHNGCDAKTIHYFSARVDNDRVVLKVKRKTGKFKELVEEVESKYKCISIVIGIPFLIKSEDEHTDLIKDYLRENEWI